MPHNGEITKQLNWYWLLINHHHHHLGFLWIRIWIMRYEHTDFGIAFLMKTRKKRKTSNEFHLVSSMPISSVNHIHRTPIYNFWHKYLGILWRCKIWFVFFMCFIFHFDRNENSYVDTSHTERFILVLWSFLFCLQSSLSVFIHFEVQKNAKHRKKLQWTVKIKRPYPCHIQCNERGKRKK